MKTNSKKVPYFDLSRQHRGLRKESTRLFGRVFDSNAFVLGRELQQFEENFSSYVGARYGIGVGSGTDALILSLVAAGIKKGDQVIQP